METIILVNLIRCMVWTVQILERTQLVCPHFKREVNFVFENFQNFEQRVDLESRIRLNRIEIFVFDSKTGFWTKWTTTRRSCPNILEHNNSKWTNYIYEINVATEGTKMPPYIVESKSLFSVLITFICWINFRWWKTIFRTKMLFLMHLSSLQTYSVIQKF